MVGGANSAGQAALHFAKFARKVTMLVRGTGLSATMSKYLIDEIERTSNIVLEARTQVVEAEGEERLEDLRLQGPQGEYRVPASSLFVFIGAQPGSGVAAGVHSCAMKRALCWPGRICAAMASCRKVGGSTREPFLLETSVPGVFVAGDVRHGSVKRVASAVGEGSIAVQFAHQYLAGF